MLIAAIVFVVLVTMFVVLVKDKEYFWVIVMISLFFAVLSLGIVKGISNSKYYKHAEEESIKLYSAYSGSTVGGSFWLGIGTVNETEYIFYWSDYGINGGLKKYKIETDKGVFFEERRDDGYAIQRKMVCNNSSLLWGLCRDSQVYEMEFHVPEGSIFSEFTVK